MVSGEMVVFRKIKEEDNEIIAKIIRANLKEKALDIPGTVYFDKNLDCLSDFYLNDENAYYCIFEVDGVVSGGVGLAAFEGIDGAAELQKLYLTNEVKGNGYGKDLINHIEEKARSMGFSSMYLETHSNLDVAIKLYERMGYEKIGRPSCVNHSTMDTFFIKSL